MQADNSSMLEKAIYATLPGDRRPTEAEVLDAASALRRAFPIGDDAFTALMKRRRTARASARSGSSRSRIPVWLSTPAPDQPVTHPREQQERHI